jgi:hypothetical protein
MSLDLERATRSDGIAQGKFLIYRPEHKMRQRRVNRSDGTNSENILESVSNVECCTLFRFRIRQVLLSELSSHLFRVL